MSSLLNNNNNHDQTNTNTQTNTKTKKAAKYIPSTKFHLKLAGERLHKNGELVAFPTETVYGLGCDATNEDAIRKVFAAKKRPFHDPLIAHILERGVDALKLWDVGTVAIGDDDNDYVEGDVEEDVQLLRQSLIALTSSSFWPGPLTIVADAVGQREKRASLSSSQATNSNPSLPLPLPTLPSSLPLPTKTTTKTTKKLSLIKVPPMLTANTGRVAVRSPSHPIARSLLKACHGTPIAAPSANLFGHVSPTSAKHVMDDLGEEDVWIVDPTMLVDENGVDVDHDVDDEGTKLNVEPCLVGVESTVVSVEVFPTADNNNDIDTDIVRGKIVVLRRGAVSASDIRGIMKNAGLYGIMDVIEVDNNTNPKTKNVEKNQIENTSAATNDNDNESIISNNNSNVDTTTLKGHIAPGLSVRHYAPNVPTYVISSSRLDINSDNNNNNSNNNNNVNQWTQSEIQILRTSLIIDVGARLISTKQYALAYKDLDPSNLDSRSAARGLYGALRWAEEVEGVTAVYLPELLVSSSLSSSSSSSSSSSLMLKEDDYDAMVMAMKDRLHRAASGIVIDKIV